MELSSPILIILSLFIFFIAFLYSSVGHGGASGYLAVLSFLPLLPAEMATTALILNILVAGIALISYFRAGHFSMALTLPFIIGSVPAAFLGGMLPIHAPLYFLILAMVLLYAAFRIAFLFAAPEEKGRELVSLPWGTVLPIGGGIGLISGMIGIGGGIFLSPLILMKQWAGAKSTSATSACFIVANALAGLGGRIAQGNFQIGTLEPLLLAGFLGGIAGSYLGANQWSNRSLRRVLAGVMVIAAIKMIFKAF